MKDHKLIEPFLHPVDPNKLGIPNYFEVIKEPMDLETVENNLKKDYYEDEKEIKSDLEKIWNNAMIFNSSDTEIFEMAQELHKYCRSLFKSNDDGSIKPVKTPPIIDRKHLKTKFMKLN